MQKQIHKIRSAMLGILLLFSFNANANEQRGTAIWIPEFSFRSILE